MNTWSTEALTNKSSYASVTTDMMCSYVAEVAPGIDDDEVLEAANQNDALLVTADKDFGELVFRLDRLSKGVVLLRLSGMAPEEKIATVSAAIAEHESELPDAFSVVSPGMVRIRARG